LHVFIRRCAWHPKYHGYSKVLGITWSGWGIEFSHGICSDCAARTRAEWRLPSAAEPAVAPPAPRRPLRSLRPDFALAAAVVLLAVTATFAVVGVPGLGPRPERRSAAVDQTSIDETSPAVRPPSSTASSTDGGSTAGGGPVSSPSAPVPSAARQSVGPAPTPPVRETAPQVAEAPAKEPSRGVSAGAGSGRARVARVRGRGVATGAAIAPVSAPETCPCQGDQGRQVAATTAPVPVAAPVPAAAPDPVAGPSNFGRQLPASRFNEVQAP
jgi:hypothetical protein